MRKLVGVSTAVLFAAAATTGIVGAGTAAATLAAPSATNAATLSPASITATQGSLNITQMQLENISATVTDTVTGQPLAGEAVRFTTVGGRFLGIAYTGNNGTASINAPENVGVGTVQELLGGYNAELLGDGTHTPVTAHAAITIGTDWS